MQSSILTIDGSQGEGGGQILRSSLSLSVCLNRPFRLINIRSGRKKPGLLRQHLTCVQAAATICGATVEGAELGSQQIEFYPGRLKPGDYHFTIGTAGSTSLVLQTVLIPLLLAEGASCISIEGGTHNPAAPSYDFLQHSFLPLLHKMGGEVSINLRRAGFYPAGGGHIEANIQACKQWQRFNLSKKGNEISRQATAMVVGLAEDIALRELKVLKKKLAIPESQLHLERCEARGIGNVLSVQIEYENLTEVFTAHGERGIRAETVAKKLSQQVLNYLAQDAPVGEYLADQLLLPIYLARSGLFLTGTPSQHTLTNASVIEQFTGHRFHIQECENGGFTIEFAA